MPKKPKRGNGWGIKVVATACVLLVVLVLFSEHHSEMQYCADCGANGHLSEWRIFGLPVTSAQSPGRANALSDYMQKHGWPREHSDWRFVDALDSHLLLGITGWYAGSHFRKIRVRDIDPKRLDDATKQFPELPLLIDQMILKLPDHIGHYSRQDERVQGELMDFLNGHKEWNELLEDGTVEHFRKMLSEPKSRDGEILD